MKYALILFSYCVSTLLSAQNQNDAELKALILEHREFVSIPNLPTDQELMLKNMAWVEERYSKLGFETSILPSDYNALLFVERVYNPQKPTVLFYFHIDGQPVNPAAWEQVDPFIPVLKEMGSDGKWNRISWDRLNGQIDEEWRIFARAAADDKAPILMFIEALRDMETKGLEPEFNIKVIFDPEEEYSSKALLSTLDQYKERYKSDYFIVMDGPIHTSNKPTLTFGCRGITTCSITTYGGKLPQHSGHYGNYVPNPVFELSNILSSMKDENGRVLVQGYYDGIHIDKQTAKLLEAVPFDSKTLNKKLGIYQAEQVGQSYQESIQYPSLNVRQIGTSWKGEGLKTVIPSYARADIDVRLVPEIDGQKQVAKIKAHLESLNYYVIDRDPTDQERLQFDKIVKFETSSRVINAFRTDPYSYFGKKMRQSLNKKFGEEPISIRTMGGTVPIVPMINALNVPTLIVPMVNMDNNQHSPNENIRIANLTQGVEICKAVLQTEL